MKRFSFYFGITAALVASCSVQEDDLKSSQKGDAVVFYASFERPSETDTKVYANEDLYLRWNADDRVSIFNKLTYNQQYRFTGETGEGAGGFKKVDTDEFVTGNPITHVVSVYPYYERTKITESEVLTLTLPAEQHYAKKSFGIGDNTMVSVSSSNVLQFKNVGGFLRISLYGKNVSVSSITLRGNNMEKLAGSASITMPQDGSPTATLSDDATGAITLICDTPIDLGPVAEESVDFWFVVPPVTFNNGFTIKVYSKDGVFSKSTDKRLTIERNIVSKMSPVFVELTDPSDPSSNVPVPDVVDLGLSVKWASFNLGASKPEEYGDYYAWGETKPYYISLDPLIWRDGKENGYDWSSYQWCMGSWGSLIKYCSRSSQGYRGFTDNKKVLEPEDDAAAVALGGKWRMPTRYEQDELREKCTWKAVSKNGVIGQNVTGPNGKTIFLPIAGYFFLDMYEDVATYVGYWSSSVSGESECMSYCIEFDFDSSRPWWNFNPRHYGYPIRPVTD